jgi:hypothetical protein
MLNLSLVTTAWLFLVLRLEKTAPGLDGCCYVEMGLLDGRQRLILEILFTDFIKQSSGTQFT